MTKLVKHAIAAMILQETELFDPWVKLAEIFAENPFVATIF
ncbi:hypothetical protein [Lusitaniella coriacea]